jgi:hydroxymethylbilane synthase
MRMGNRLVLATRRSPLALAQAKRAAAHLRERLGAECELLQLVTTGDRQAEWSLEEKGGKGLFTRELEAALLRRDADVAVHSAKDLPGESAAGLSTAGYLPREDPADMLVLRAGVGAPRTIATGSPRRRHQAAMLFPGARFVEIRGNVDTRLMKIAERGVADATILAAAGLKRLGIGFWPGLEFHSLGFGSMVPARFAGIFDAQTALGLGLERAIQSALGGGCHTALGAYASAGTLFFFHESVGLRTTPIDGADLALPVAGAERILRRFGLK